MGIFIKEKFKPLVAIGLFICFIGLFLMFNIFNPSFAFAVLLAAVALLFFSWKLEFGIYLMALFLPIIHWTFEIRGFEAPLIDLIGVGLIASFILNAAAKLIVKQEMDIKFPIIFPYFLFCLVVFLSALFSETAVYSFWYAARWILFFYAAFIFLPYNIIKTEKIFRRTLIFLSASGLLAAANAVFSLLDQNILYELIRFKPTGIFGVYPFGDNQNLLVEALIPALFSLLALKYWHQDNAVLNRLLNLGVLALSLVLIGTFSRAGWIALAVGSLFVLFYQYRYEAKKTILPILLVLALSSPFYFQMFNIQTASDIGVSSTENRLLLSKITWDAFKEKPFFGQGPGTFEYLVADNLYFTARYGAPLDSHGVLQKILAENGFLGMVFFSFMIFYIYRALIRGIKNSLSVRSFIADIKSIWVKKVNKTVLLLPLVGGAVSIFIIELFNTSYYKGKLWFPIAVALVAVKLIEERKIYGDKKA